MTLFLRRAVERGYIDRDPFKSKLSFSFGDYYNPNWLGFGALYAINENEFAPGYGLAAPHRRDLEILTLVRSGRLRHRDSLGSDLEAEADSLLRLRAGSGVDHREDNASPDTPLRALRLYLLPETRGAAPRFDAASFAGRSRRKRLLLLGSKDGRDGSLSIDRDVDLYISSLDAGDVVAHPLGRDREAWVQVLDGEALVNGVVLRAGDGVGVRDVDVMRLEGGAGGFGELLVLDMSCE